MQKRVQPFVLLYGNSFSLDIVKKELPENYGLPVLHIDPAVPEAVKKGVRRAARLLVYDQNSVDLEMVTSFQLKNPYAPVVCLKDETRPELEVSFRDNSRIETSGLPQVLQVLEECWDRPVYGGSC